MKITHLALIAGIASGLTLTAVAQDSNSSPAGTAASSEAASTGGNHHRGGHLQKRSRSRHRKQVKEWRHRERAPTGARAYQRQHRSGAAPRTAHQRDRNPKQKTGSEQESRRYQRGAFASLALFRSCRGRALLQSAPFFVSCAKRPRFAFASSRSCRNESTAASPERNSLRVLASVFSVCFFKPFDQAAIEISL